MTDATADPIETRLKQALADRYAVEQKLGEGGMALVYLARDLKHDRLVALKILKPDLAASIGADRFLKEIRHTAKLSHPHILPLYDSGEADRLLYYVMPFVEGESLSDLVRREKQLAIHEAVKITREVAEALGYAHSYGLIHRDIKPDNILMSGGHAIVADFGISKALTEAGGSQLTQTGTSVGTPAYMSPEQAMGSADLDGRSDIYSLGCVLYQMLVGDVPFTGPTPQAVMARHTMDHITAPSIMRDTIPAELEEIIFTAMAKTPADRFRTAQEMAEALQAVETGGVSGRPSTVHRLSTAQRMSGMQGGASGMVTPQTPVPTVAVPGPQPAWKRAAVPAGVAVGVVTLGIVAWQLLGNRGAGPSANVETLDPRRVAVLYFEDLSIDGGWTHVADGLTEGLIAKLGEVRELDVVSENGVAPYRGIETSRDSIARVLETGSLVAGSVEPLGERLRVTARLVEGRSGADIERASFELPANQLLAAVDSVAEAVSRFLRRRLGEEIRLRERRAGAASVEAWGLVQRGERLRKDALQLANRDDSEGAARLLQQADSILQVAEAADLGWVEPVLLRGWIAYDRQKLERGEAALPWIKQGLTHADRALVLSPDDPRALELRGTLRFRHFSLRVTPNQDEWEQLLFSAREDLEAAVQADPSLASAHVTLSYVYYQPQIDDVPGALMAARRGYEADAYLEKADDLLNRLFWGSLDLEQFSQARRWCAEGERRFPNDFRFAACELWLMVTPAVPPDPDRAWRLLTLIDTLTRASQREYHRTRATLLVGGVLARAGFPDSSRNVLDRAHSAITSEIDPHQDLLSVEAYLRTLLGEKDQAIDLLKRYVAANPDHDFAQQAGTMWWWRDLRTHPRFKEVAQPSH